MTKLNYNTFTWKYVKVQRCQENMEKSLTINTKEKNEIKTIKKL